MMDEKECSDKQLQILALKLQVSTQVLTAFFKKGEKVELKGPEAEAIRAASKYLIKHLKSD